MRLNANFILIAIACLGSGLLARDGQPYGPVPTARQLKWHEMEVYAFLHFTINTFTDKEWGYGDESPTLFNPTEFDADIIVRTMKAGGMKGLILTAKHHDGFCLWPTKTTEHNISRSPFRGTKGDVVKEISKAARRHGLKFGVYLSPWDRNSPHYGKPEYINIYREQLRELLTWYGPIFEVWHDGANGGDGFYGGSREKRNIDPRTYYDWPKTWELVRNLQPNAVIFSDIGPDIRWVGNERGFAAETSWATYSPVGEDGGVPAPGFTRWRQAPEGTRNGAQWLPAECDVSIRPGWFWHESENTKVKTPAQLFDLYFKSVGRGGSLLLNVPPDRRGLIHEKDAESLRGFGDLLRNTFRVNLARGATAMAAVQRAGNRPTDAHKLLDNDRYSYWNPKGINTPEVGLRLAGVKTFDVIRLRENIKLGQRVEGIAVDIREGDAWREVCAGTSIGNCRLIKLDKPVTTSAVRLRVTASPVPPAISELALFKSASGI